MEDERERRVEELFHAARELAPQARRALLAPQADDLRAEVLALLELHERPSSLLDQPLVARALAPDGAVPECIGPYAIEGVLGEGGMGVVYRARQASPRRAVALKVLRPGLWSPQSLARFRREAEVLARLHHPGIAQIHEAGTADAGAGPQPYLALELVEGPDLLAHAERERLPARARLELLTEVCDALHHAHERGVVHRDLKPSNVLVDGASGEPRPKVVDFGIARALVDDPLVTSLRTHAGQVLGTIPYMAPEQAAGGEQVDRRADVYALGVVAYQLLCGRLPLDLAGRALPDALRALREEEPAPLGRLRPALRGDVETIVAKALEKDPARRYASAAELAADLRRHLASLPIAARPASTVYRLGRFARRHRAVVAGLAAVFAALCAGLAGTTWQAVRAGEQAERADRALERSQAVARFQREVLAQVAPRLGGRDLRLVDVLDATAQALPGDLAREPDVEAALRATLGEAYLQLGAYDAARAQLERSAALFRGALGPWHVETRAAEAGLGRALASLGRHAQAEELLRTALADLGPQLEGGERSALIYELDRASALKDLGRLEEAEALARTNHARRVRAYGEGDPRTADALGLLGAVLGRQGRLEESAAVQRAAFDLLQAAGAEGEASAPFFASRLGNALRALGRNEEAVALYRQALDLGRPIYGEDHPDVLTWRNNLAGALQDLGEREEALAELEAVLARRRAHLGEAHENTLLSMNNLALLYAQLGRHGEALELQREALAAKRATLGPEHPSTLTSLYNLALALLLSGDAEQALPLFREVAEVGARALPAGHWRVAFWREAVGACLQRLGRLDEAAPELQAALEQMRAAVPEGDARVRAIAARLRELHLARGRPEEARALEPLLAAGAQGER